MEYLDKDEIISLAVKSKGKWAVYIANNLDFDNDYDTKCFEYIRDKCTEMYPDNKFNIIGTIINGGLFFFSTEEETKEFFEIFNVRDITYASGMYAAMYDVDGYCLTENT